jgi:hypothetical protein
MMIDWIIMMIRRYPNVCCVTVVCCLLFVVSESIDLIESFFSLFLFCFLIFCMFWVFHLLY